MIPEPSPAAAPTASLVPAPPRRVLFVCVQNSARSQIAEALARTVAPADTQIWSAGTRPSSVHPLAIEVMAEAGIDLSGHRSKHLDEVPWSAMDTIISLCSEGDLECPAVGDGVRRVYWPLEDPAAAAEPDRLRAFRETREELRWRVACLWPVRE